MTLQKVYKVLRDSTSLLKNPQYLREQAHNEGYLYFPGLIDQKEIMNLRGQILQICENHGFLDTHFPMMDGIVRKNIKVIESDKAEWKAFYKDIIRLRDFNALSINHNILELMSILFQETVLPHCKNICRLFSPMHNEYCSPPHRDYTWTGGTDKAWACWIPLGDIPRKLGGLLILPGSHQREFQLRGGDERKGLIILEDVAWYTADKFICGDVVIFHSKTVHAGGGNYTENQLRLSVDFRYQPLSEPIRYDALLPHWEGFGLHWDDIYSNWPEHDDLKYFWQKLHPVVVQETPGTYQQNIRARYIQNLMRTPAIQD